MKGAGTMALLVMAFVQRCLVKIISLNCPFKCCFPPDSGDYLLHKVVLHHKCWLGLILFLTGFLLQFSLLTALPVGLVDGKRTGGPRWNGAGGICGGQSGFCSSGLLTVCSLGVFLHFTMAQRLCLYWCARSALPGQGARPRCLST